MKSWAYRCLLPAAIVLVGCQNVLNPDTDPVDEEDPPPTTLERAADVVFDPEGGTYDEDITVTLSCPTSGATIYYTIGASPDDPEPNASGTFEYTASIEITGDGTVETIKAVAVADGHKMSAVSTATFTISVPPPPPPPPDDPLKDVEYRTFVSVAGGEFLQQDVSGNSFDHTVSSFRLARHQVTYELWYAVRVWAESNGYTFANLGREGSGGEIGLPPSAAAKLQPVTSVSFYDVLVWLNAYSELEEMTPVYYTNAGHTVIARDAAGAVAVSGDTVNWNADGYRLPTEGEWEYAARWRGSDDSDAGVLEYPDASGRFWTPPDWASGASASYTNEAATTAVAWYAANSGGRTRAVGGRTPNQLGIYDMSGNVWEWMWDWLSGYPDTSQEDYRGPDSGGPYRVGRGGSWNNTAQFTRTGYRDGARPEQILEFTGFRVAGKTQ